MQELLTESSRQGTGVGEEADIGPRSAAPESAAPGSAALESRAEHRVGDVGDRRGSAMRVVHIIKHCGHANGSVHVAVDLACIQAEAGYDVTFVSAGGTFEPLLAQYGVQLITLEHEQGRPLSMLRAAGKLALLARRNRPDVLHAHMMSSAVVGYMASKLSGVPLITTVHNSFDRHSLLMRLGRRVVSVSEAERERLLDQGYKGEKLVAVMNAPSHSPREAFMQNERALEIESPCITSTAGLHRRKGVFDLIDACAELFREIPRWRLYIAGEGPDRAALEDQVRARGIADRVIFLGFLPDTRPLLEKSEIFVLASYADPCSLAIGEARTAGCAIVATNVGGTPEMLDFGNAGRLVSPGNPKGLAAELRRLMLDDELRRELKRASLKGSEVFNAHRLLGDYEAVYRDAQRA